MLMLSNAKNVAAKSTQHWGWLQKKLRWLIGDVGGEEGDQK